MFGGRLVIGGKDYRYRYSYVLLSAMVAHKWAPGGSVTKKNGALRGLVPLPVGKRPGAGENRWFREDAQRLMLVFSLRGDFPRATMIFCGCLPTERLPIGNFQLQSFILRDCYASFFWGTVISSLPVTSA